jgi:acetamidase/formamidase
LEAVLDAKASRVVTLAVKLDVWSAHICPAGENMARRYEIPATPENMVWGYLDSTSPPVLTMSSGDTVTLHSFPAGGKETLPDDLSLVPADYLKAIETLPPGPGPHFITGPVYVKGAQAGDTLQIEILDVKVRQDWGFVSILTFARNAS